MDFWMSMELSKDVLTEEDILVLGGTQNEISREMVQELEKREYNIPLDKWRCITIMMGDRGFSERVMYSFKKREMDFRLKIDHVPFLAANKQGKQQLIFEMLMRSLDLLEEKFKKVRPKLDSDVYSELNRLREDAQEIAKKQGWIF
nr:Imm44 family immunity protein [Acinetobacter sp. Marseille-Q1620]